MTPEHIAAVAGKLTKAQRDLVILAATSHHAVTREKFLYTTREIINCLRPYDNGQPETYEYQTAFQITPLGLAVRDYLEKEARHD